MGLSGVRGGAKKQSQTHEVLEREHASYPCCTSDNVAFCQLVKALSNALNTFISVHFQHNIRYYLDSPVGLPPSSSWALSDPQFVHM